MSPGLESLHFEMDSRTLLSSYVLPLITGLLPDDDPEAAFEAGRKKVIAGHNLLPPSSGTSRETTKAVADVVAEFPRVKHAAVLEVEAVDPVTLDASLAATREPARLPALLRGVALTARYPATLR